MNQKKPCILLLSNVNVDGIVQRLRSDYTVVPVEGYNTWVQHISGSSGRLDSQIDVCCLILDGGELARNIHGLDNLRQEMDRCFSLVSGALQRHPTTKFFISNLDIDSCGIRSLKEVDIYTLAECYWVECLWKAASQVSNAYVFDLKKLVTQIGRKQFYSSKLWYLGGMKYSMAAESVLVAELSRVSFFMTHSRKKCIVVDLDNTLWGGVLGEEGLLGISLSDYKEGGRFKDFQRVLKQIKDNGVMLCVCSKNNEGEVLEVFEKHPHMVLRKEDFVALKVNWRSKDLNVAEICGELNIGSDAVVFIDDNPFERDLVKVALPDLVVPDFPADTSKLPEFAMELYDKYFFKLEQTAEDRMLTEAYAANYERKHLQESSASYEDFLNALDMNIRIWKATVVDLPRIHQLVHKTNQFNLTTIRYTGKEIASMANDESCCVYCLSVSDRFGNNGTVGLIVLRLDGAGLAEIDTFILSCRVMGRELESAFLGSLETLLFSRGISRIKARYIPTLKNLPVENLFERLGYELTMKGANNDKRYELTKKNYLPIANSRKCYGKIRIDDV